MKAEKNAPTEVERTRAGRVWAAGNALQCEVLIWLALQYPPESCEKFILLKWDELGRPLQDDVTRAVTGLWALLVDRS